MLEIERKFRLNEKGEEWVKAWMPKTEGYGNYKGSYLIEQAYPYLPENNGVRVRCQVPMNMPDDVITDGFVTRKTPSQVAHAVNEEEYRIPPAAARILIEACAYIVTKHRVHYEFKGRLWEIDLFTGMNNGLIVAEIEFKNQADYASFQFDDMPPWLGEEVTDDPKYKNVNLALKPFKTW